MVINRIKREKVVSSSAELLRSAASNARATATTRKWQRYSF